MFGEWGEGERATPRHLSAGKNATASTLHTHAEAQRTVDQAMLDAFDIAEGRKE